jgi:transcriptional regulator with XRE-family HTH domain
MKNIYASIENLRALGERVAMVRDHCDLNISRLARKLDISHSFLSQIISAKRKPSYEFLCGLSVKLNINLHWLFTGEGEMISGQRIDNDLYKLVLGLGADAEVKALLLDLRVSAMKHFLLAHHQLLSWSPGFKLQKEAHQLQREAK